LSDIYAYVDRRQREAGRQIPARRGAATAEISAWRGARRMAGRMEVDDQL